MIRKINTVLCTLVFALALAFNYATVRKAYAALPAGPCPSIINSSFPCSNRNPITRQGTPIPVCHTVGPYYGVNYPYNDTVAWTECCSYLKRPQICSRGYKHGGISYLRGRSSLSACRKKRYVAITPVVVNGFGNRSR